ncbi:Periplasmic serine proteases (ClpP class) [Tritonibacter mobilis]|uniref:S49 family peptidase n=1 Tax=Tritonibacter mobilis TaxID=379347 RepID=UPI000F6E2DFC|nr:S49 family peptidase [Tritonibacter mobilis]VCU58266.1 Periplasmic serine proteases (ClpP class) [Tritonibacter mobilis]
MKQELTALVAAIRAQPWAIMPDYLNAIEAIALRALDEDVLRRVAQDGHVPRLEANLSAVAAVGTRLEGTGMSTIRDGTAVVPMFGPIFPRASMVNASTDGTSLDAYMRDIRVAQASTDVTRIVTLVDSPGGVVSGLGEAAETLRASAKPITAFVTGNCASAAYWLCSQVREIVLDRSAAVGSIGVVASMSRQEVADVNGRRSYEIVSSNAPDKRPDPSTEEGRASIQTEIDAVETLFIEDVANGRGVSVDHVRAEFGRGALVSAKRAIAAGMADRVGTLEGVLTEESGRTRKTGAGRSARATAEIEARRRAAMRN